MTPRWLVLTVRVPSEELQEALAEGLLALGGSAIEEDVDLLTTYVPEPPDADAFLAAAVQRLDAVAADAELLWRWQEDEDWSRRWREGLEPRRVTDRIIVTQPWNPVEEDDDAIVITLDPATAFGTGEHATTRGALRLLEDAIAGGERVLDVGTGTGVLAIAAVRLGAGRVVAPELDGNAISNGLENVERNGVADRVDLHQGRVDAEYLDRVRDSGFDVITANVLSSVLIPLLPEFARALVPGGRMILGGILQSEAEEVSAAARASGFRRVKEDREAEWWTALFQAPERG